MCPSRASPDFLFWQARYGRALGAKTPLLRRLWQERFQGAVLALQAPVFAVIKSAKAGPCPFPKQGDVDTYPSHPMALPGLPSQEASGRDRSAPNTRWPVHFRSGFSKAVQRFNAGWSSPVARQAHNLKVICSNPSPATKDNAKTPASWLGFSFWR
jgi:hypothetical protein